MKKIKVTWVCNDCGERTINPMELDDGKVICPSCDVKRLINNK